MITDIITLSAIIGAESEVPLKAMEINQLLTDSRSLSKAEGTLFFALRTGNNEGSRYIPGLYAAGVRNFVIDENMVINRTDYQEANILRVKDTLCALQRIGAWVRELAKSAEVIGITGSAGKTTLKEWLYQSLFTSTEIVRSPRSYNSQIGVPLSLWEIEPEHTRIALIEAGVSQKGEMERLQHMISPTIGIITNIGEAHSDAFESYEAKCKEKCKLFIHAKAIIYNCDDPIISQCINQTCGDSVKHIAWSNQNRDAYVYVEATDLQSKGVKITYLHNGNAHTLNVPGKLGYDVENALHSLTLLLYLGYSPSKINYMIGNVAYFGTRIEVREGCNRCVIVSDSYTNDIHSLQQAMEFMNRRSDIKQMNRTAIISDFASENTDSRSVYESAANLLNIYHFSRVIGIGKDISANAIVFSTIKKADFYRNADDFIQRCPVSEFAGEQILVKGRGEQEVTKIVEHLEARRNETVLEVNLDALADNYNTYRRMLNPTTGIICMIKASGYGAGSYEIAKTLQDRGAAYLAVAVVDEGADLRNAGITMPIMVMNPRVADYKSLFSNHLEPEIYSIEMCAEIIKEAKKLGISNYPIHIKIDSGMHRLGFREEQLSKLIEMLKCQDSLYVKSVFTHLCVADEDTLESNEYTKMQFEYYENCADMLQSGLPQMHILRHALNSAGIVRFKDKQYDMVRLGLGLYGISPCSDNSVALRPVSSLHTNIISINEWQAGTTIGYGRKGVITRRTKIATIPVGYADGIDRRCGNGNVSFVVKGVKCPTVGNICMDACMIDITDVQECKVGDNVEIFGKTNTATDIAAAIGTIPYEVLTSVSPRVKRVYFRE